MTVSNNESHAEESTLPLEDGEVHVCKNGPRDSPVLLFIHRTAASAGSWKPMVPLLTGSHRVIRIDLLGCGPASGIRHGRRAPPGLHREPRPRCLFANQWGEAHVVVLMIWR